MQDSIYHDTKIAFNSRFSHQNVKILLQENSTFYGRQHITLRSNLHFIVFNAWLYYTLRRDVIC